MALPQGIAFRSTIAYVTDVSPDYCENSDDDTESGATDAATYPQTTPQGNNVGWETLGDPVGSRNRNTTNARLAGRQYGQSATVRPEYRIDLPSTGSKNIRLACGDWNYGSSATNIELFDTTTSLGVLASATTSAAQRFIDATNVERTSGANWVSSNASVAKTFSTTILRFKMGTGAAAGGISFFYVEDGAGAPATRPLQPMVVRQAVNQASVF